VIATVAGADPSTAGRLALSMFGLQASIGALNDLVDAPIDAGRKPGKPVPRGLVSPRDAALVAGVTGVAGLGLSALSGAPTLAAAVAAIGLGYVYDLRLSRTRLSWLPLALALPVLPIHAWLGATGSIPSGLVSLLPVAVMAGAALALGNGLVDAERDAASGRRGIVVALGARRAWLVQSGLMAIVVAAAILLAPVGAGRDGVLGVLRMSGIPLGGTAIALGVAALLARSPRVRERGWELEAMGVAAAGVAWLAGTAAAAGPA
jgi:4-hydroxybenzoate polyprenyltransferase